MQILVKTLVVKGRNREEIDDGMSRDLTNLLHGGWDILQIETLADYTDEGYAKRPGGHSLVVRVYLRRQP